MNIRAVRAHFRRKFFDLQQAHASPVASEALQRVAAPYAIEKEVGGGRRFRAGVVCFSFILSTQHIRSPVKRWVRVTLTDYRS